MALRDYNTEMEDYTRLASGAARQLAFAGIAVVWVFRATGENGAPVLPKGLALAVLCFALALALDLGQYVVGWLIYKAFHRRHEKVAQRVGEQRGAGERAKYEDSVEMGVVLANVTHGIWFFKVVAVLAGYFPLVCYLWGAWRRAV